MAQQTTWPALDSQACRDTIATLHLYVQVIGKVQLALSPAQAEWAQAPLRLDRARPVEPAPADRRAKHDDRARPHRATSCAST